MVEQSCLLPDLHLLPNGDMTEVFASLIKELKLSLLYLVQIGEKGINLSGGQKQRVCISSLFRFPSVSYI